MILIDYREENATKRKANLDLMQHIRRIGVKAETADLQFGDAAFELKGPDGTAMVGIERKGLHDMLNCIDDARYTGSQRIGMKSMYDISVLMIEGHWKPHDPHGILMEGFNGGVTWGYCRYRSQRTMYAKLYRYLISVSLTGVIVTYSRDPFQTAYNICEWFHYGEKPWHEHTSQQEMHKITLPALTRKPNLTRKWAADIDGIGMKLSSDAERLFRTPLRLATSDEMDWLKIKGVGVPTAQAIMRQIWGTR